MKINLKRATLADIDTVLAIEKSIIGVKTYSGLSNKDEVTGYIGRDFFYLIEKDGEVVGDVSYEIKDKNNVYLSGLAVMPKFQGQGIARETVRIILEMIKDFKSVDLVTHPDNEKAIKLYDSFGFKKYGERIENYFGDGEPRIKMVLIKIK